MFAYIIRRILAMFLVLFVALTFIFFLLRVVPGDPAEMQAGLGAPKEYVDALREKWGLDKPVIAQYGLYLRQVFRGDFGNSTYTNLPAIEPVLERLPHTLLLAFAGLGLAVAISYPLGILAAMYANTLLDRAIVAFSLLGRSMPGFWTGIMAILLFSRRWRLLPSYGSGGLKHLVLPTCVVASVLLAVLVRITRSDALDELGKDYVRTAYSKGLSQTGVMIHHVARNSLISVITVVGLQLGRLMGGAVITETVFSWPGIGSLLVQTLGQRDYAVVQCVLLVFAGLFAVCNLVTDVLYTFVNPRIRF